MPRGLQIPNPRERLLVQAADAFCAPLRWFRAGAPTRTAPRRILLLRLERIGDLLMVYRAIAQVRAQWPDAAIDLAVGSWNAPIARLMPEITTVHFADVPWLAREGTGLSWPALVARARTWRRDRYDLVINFEPDIRSNLLAWLSGAPVRVGYWTGGGGALLTHASAYDPARHVSDNATDLVRETAGHLGTTAAPDVPMPRLQLPDDATRAAAELVGSHSGVVAGLHVSGGRPSKQWHLDRFAEVGRALAADGALVVLTGGAGDRPLVDAVLDRLGPVPVINTAGTLNLTVTAALLARLDVLVTGDTGPMHLAAAVGTPVVALFGPSDPRRYGPLGDGHQVLRVQLPCSPCGLVRLPPDRCRGRVPECLDSIAVDTVVAHARAVIGARGGVS